ncbi:heme-dependent oxidative N-demethylase family protein [Nisaea sp.]|uniref:heme-dependent oxidative N-demethylase family protein n=1 Tax=Nisaea sp. TaxID=2024842 RepID=UPI003B52D209
MTAREPGGPRYAPYANGRFALAMGLVALDPKDWIDADDRRAAELQEKERLLAANRKAVFDDLPGSEAAQREVLVILLENLERHHPGLVGVEDGTVTVRETGKSYGLADFSDHALDLAGRLVQEDFCLMRPGEEGYVLHAASLCFPARWKLAEKLGQPMMRIHERVSGYAERLGRPVDRFFEHLRADKPVQRLNWSLVDDPALFQTGGKFRTAEDAGITPENAGDRLWLRVERQTLRRLPESGDILFTIRTFVDPLSCLEARPDLAAALRASLDQMPEGMQLYKSLPPFRDALDRYLERVSSRAA